MEDGPLRSALKRNSAFTLENAKLRKRISELEQVCAELYQVIGSLASYAGVFDHADVERALDNASEAKLVHVDLLPWPRDEELAGERVSELEEENQRLREALQKIADPLAYLIERAKADGMLLNTPEALLLANDPNYLTEIARAALSQEEKP